ncbi:MAG: hypothetical protein ACHQD7_12305 [Chitinophagales bacterium]
MGISEITLYNLLRKKMGEQETYELVEFIHSEVKAEMDSRTNAFLTKEYLKSELDSRTNIFPTKEYLRTELGYLRTELDSKTSEFPTKEYLRTELGYLRTEMGYLRTEMDSKINEFLTKEYLRTEMGYLRTELDSKTSEFLTKNDKIELIDRINKVRSEVTKVKTELIVWLVSVGVLQYLLLMLTKKFF